MKKILLLPVLAVLLAFVPFPGQDVAKLEPLEILYLSEKDGLICFQSDVGDTGIGDDIEAALADLHRRSSGEVFLETADYLLMKPELQSRLPEMYDILRPGCRVCLVEGEPELEKLSEFLHTHEPESTLMEYQAGRRALSILHSEGGRVYLAE